MALRPAAHRCTPMMAFGPSLLASPSLAGYARGHQQQEATRAEQLVQCHLLLHRRRHSKDGESGRMRSPFRGTRVCSIAGWVSSFCAWRVFGRSQLRARTVEPADSSSSLASDAWFNASFRNRRRHPHPCEWLRNPGCRTYSHRDQFGCIVCCFAAALDRSLRRDGLCSSSSSFEAATTHDRSDA